MAHITFLLGSAVQRLPQIQHPLLGCSTDKTVRDLVQSTTPPSAPLTKHTAVQERESSIITGIS